MYVIIVKSKVKPEKVTAYESTFRDLRQKVLEREPGVTFYELCRLPDEPCSYRLVEAYTDQDAQNIHLATDYYQAAVSTIMDCLVGGSYEMETLQTI
jgi:quinol monooxygenase YgiN